MIFNYETYELLESKTTINKDGDEILVNSYKYVANEILPAGSEVAWDLSDLKDVTFIDDADAEFGDMMPQVIIRSELAANTTSGYVLNNIPEGFEEEITAAPRQNEETYSYVATYRSETGGLIVLQSAGDIPETLIESEFNEKSYQTAAGFVLYLGKSTDVDDGNKITHAVVKTPDGFHLFLNASLPPDQIKSLAEELVTAK